MADDYLEELLQSSPAALDDVVTEPVGEDLARQGGDGNPGGLALEDVAEVFKVGIPAADGALAQLESGDVCAANDLVVGIHGAAHAVSPRVANLIKSPRQPPSSVLARGHSSSWRRYSLIAVPPDSGAYRAAGWCVFEDIAGGEGGRQRG